MKKLQLLLTAAAAVLLSAGLASAQTNKQNQTIPHSAQQMNGPSAEHGRSGPAAENHSKSTEHKPSTTGEAQRAEGSKKSTSHRPSTTGQASSSKEHDKNGAPSSAESKNEHNANVNQSGENNASKAKPSKTGQASQEEKSTQGKNAGSENELQENAGAKKSSTTGQASKSESNATEKHKSGASGQVTTSGTSNPAQKPNASSSKSTQTNNQASANVQGANLNEHQVTRVRQTIFANKNVPRVNNVDFSIRVGTAVPSHIHLVAVPSTIVDLYPEWRDDEYIVVRDEIVIVDHRRNIVAVIPAGSHEARGGGSVIAVSDLSPAEIRQIQIVLVRRGYYDGDVDGIFGPNTREAMITFQRHEGLHANGEITTQTVSSLGLSGKINVSGKSSSGKSTVGQGQSGQSRRNASSNESSPSATTGQGRDEPSVQSGQSAKPNNNMSSNGQASEKPNAPSKETTGSASSGNGQGRASSRESGNAPSSSSSTNGQGSLQENAPSRRK